VVGLFVGATIVTVAQYLRVRVRALLLIAMLFALGAVAESQEDPASARRWHAASGACALVLAIVLSPRQPPTS
jgi:hypothetical protein